jgi:hypothetical protein
MARAVYIVLHSREKWWVDFEGRAFGPFSSKNTATMEAISLARFIAHTGRQAEVRAPDGSGRFPVEWESEPDRFRRPPPRLPPSRGAGEAADTAPLADADADADDVGDLGDEVEDAFRGGDAGMSAPSAPLPS